jgi:hypothetical protein
MHRRRQPTGRSVAERRLFVRALRHVTGATLPDMESATACLRCNSGETMVPNVEVVTYPESGSSAKGIELIYDQNPDALVFKERLHARAMASVCCTCGHIELIMGQSDRQALWSAYQARRNG